MLESDGSSRPAGDETTRLAILIVLFNDTPLSVKFQCDFFDIHRI
jgi:hypothetical protein